VKISKHIKISIILVSFVIGLLLAVQYKSFQGVSSLLQRTEPNNVFTELRIFQLANKELRITLQLAENALAELQTKLSKEAIDEEIQRLKLLNGDSAINGEGVQITLSQSVKAFWINDLIAQLVATGAEAIAVNDIRLLESTAGIRDIGGGILMRRHFLRSPFSITAIGPREDMQKAIAQTGGIIDRIEDANPGLKLIVAERESLLIPALVKDR